MKRPENYNYYDNLIKHVGSDYKFFDGEFVYPRQLEIHLPADTYRHCNLRCSFCQGSNYTRELGNWELEGLDLLNNLAGAIPYHIYGGAYTEPLMNLHLLTYLSTTKKWGNKFGIHTNGVLLNTLQKEFMFITRLSELATDAEDYISISLDGGVATDWAKAKNVENLNLFVHAIKGIYKLGELKKKYSLRLCFLISKHTGNYENFREAVYLAKAAGADSLRFSIPYAIYNQKFDKLEKYRDKVEKPLHNKYYPMLQEFLSKSTDEKPYIFYVDPVTTSVDQYTFSKCIYSYYQITLGADGYFYKCSAVAAPDAKEHRLGKIGSELWYFNDVVARSYDKNFDCKKMCFSKGLRCNRMAIECNQAYCKGNV
jgi:MoaA/NifB/PqqE/SkfB family radical SAM enzyme